MGLLNSWTGRAACSLQAALRLSNESFARKLGIAVRTVASWHQRPDITPRPEIQQLLDTISEQASPAEKARLAKLLEEDTTRSGVPAPRAADGVALTVAIAVVTNESDVLIVQRRGEEGGGIMWQFPAGMVKPGVSSELVAVRETLAETSVHCHVTRHLGSRIHPITHVLCDYLLCEYLAGEPRNADPVENVSAIWTPRDRLTRFIPVANIYPPILEALEIIE
jgi:8-oxo-dGTP diphosphatase